MAQGITFIINPASGFGKTRRRLRPLIKEIRAQKDDAVVWQTHHAFHAIALTKLALQNGARRIVVVGGDGTLNEAVNGFFDKDGKPYNSEASLAIVPSGTGSDFARSTALPHDLPTAIDMAISGLARPTDVGLVEAFDNNGQKVSRYFLNEASLGLSGLVAGYMKNITRKLGSTSAYFLSTLQAIRTFRPPNLVLIGPNGQRETFNNCSLVSFSNGRYFGSGMHIAPNAVLDDGLFEVITIQDLSALFFLINGYRVYQGSHLSLDNVNTRNYSECSVESLSSQPVYVETDGELFAQLPATFKVRQKIIPFVR